MTKAINYDIITKVEKKARAVIDGRDEKKKKQSNSQTVTLHGPRTVYTGGGCEWTLFNDLKKFFFFFQIGVRDFSSFAAAVDRIDGSRCGQPPNDTAAGGPKILKISYRSFIIWNARGLVKS